MILRAAKPRRVAPNLQRPHCLARFPQALRRATYHSTVGCAGLDDGAARWEFLGSGGTVPARGEPAMTEGEAHEVVSGDGYAVGNIDALGDGGGFRKIRQALDVKAFGINLIVMPPEFVGRRH